jgi:molybdenum ABC transporter molybdate-binding protein
MSDETQEWMKDWTVGVRLWIERAGEAVLGPGRLELLEAIDRCRSISAAARQLGMSYRHAWLLVDGVNRAAGEELVRRQTGGRDGGGAVLTPRGRAAIAAYRALQSRIQQTAALGVETLGAETLGALTQPRSPAVVHVAAAVSLENVLHCLLADFAVQHPSVSVRAVCGASDELATYILNGLPIDLFLSAADGPLDRLEHAGILTPQARIPLGANRLAAVTARSGLAKLSGPRALLQEEVRSIALADPSCPLGQYTRTYLEPLGLWNTIRQRAVFLDNPRVVLAAVESGQADVGFVYRSDVSTTSHCRLLFTSRAAQPTIRYTAALTRHSEQSPSARTLLAFLTSPPARRRLRRFGFQVPQSTHA